MIYVHAAVALLLSVLRISGVMVSPNLGPDAVKSLQAVAHLFDGILLAGGWLSIDAKYAWFRSDPGYAVWMGVGLALVELGTFVLTRHA